MTSRILLDPCHNLNPEICKQCSTCIHWDVGLSPSYARVSGRRIQVAQCMCEEDGAPYGEVSGPFDAAVFTHAECRCRAYDPHPEALADAHALTTHYAELDRQLFTDAWM